MVRLIRKLLGQSAVYGLGAMAVSLCTVILAPIYLRRMNLGEYGRLEMLNAFGSILGTALALGVVTVLPKMFVHDCKDSRDRKRLLSSVLALAAVGATLIFSVCWIFSGRLAVMLCSAPHYRILVLLAVGSSGFLLIQRIVTVYLTVEQWAAKFLAVSITQVAATLAMNVYLVWFGRMGVYGAQLSSIAGVLISLALAVVLARSCLTVRISFGAIKQVLRLSIPVMPATMVPWVLNVSDRYFLKHSHGLSYTGLYAVGYKIGMMALILFINAFAFAWMPFFQMNSDGPDAKRMCAKIAKYYMMALMVLALVISIYAPEIIHLLSKREYWTAADFHTCALIVPFIALSYVLNGMQLFTVPMFTRNNRGKWLSWVMGSAALLDLVLNAVLIPAFGIWGATAATLVSFAAAAIVCQWISGVDCEVPFEYWNYLKLVVASAIVYLLFSRLPCGSVSAVLLKLTSPAVYGLILLAVRFADDREIELVQGIPTKVMKKFGLNAYGPM